MVTVYTHTIPHYSTLCPTLGPPLDDAKLCGCSWGRFSVTVVQLFPGVSSRVCEPDDDLHTCFPGGREACDTDKGIVRMWASPFSGGAESWQQLDVSGDAIVLWRLVKDFHIFFRVVRLEFGRFFLELLVSGSHLPLCIATVHGDVWMNF